MKQKRIDEQGKIPGCIFPFCPTYMPNHSVVMPMNYSFYRLLLFSISCICLNSPIIVKCKRDMCLNNCLIKKRRGSIHGYEQRSTPR